MAGPPSQREVVITGIGVVSPVGTGRQAFWQSLLAGCGGIGPITHFDASGLPVRIAGEVRDFDGRQYVRPRKNLKVMARDAQLAVASVDLACREAALAEQAVEPERCGVVFGADRIRNEFDDIRDTYLACFNGGQFDSQRWGTHGLAATYPLIMLKNLPNMVSCHISIACDARGLNNTICSDEASGLLAVGEAASAIARDAADIVLAGGAASRMHPIDWVRACLYEELAPGDDDPRRACRPFDRLRCGQVRGEGAAALVLESRLTALRRQAPILARVLGWGSGFGPRGAGIARACQAALRMAQLDARQIGHINAHGLGTRDDDRDEAQALASVLPGVAVFAPKGYFGNLHSAAGAVELVASVLAVEQRIVPMTLNYEHPAAECPVPVVRGEPFYSAQPVALAVNATRSGQAAAVVIAAP
jgi:3-oxoacyl-[acyl-carrier-protein] synthase II